MKSIIFYGTLVVLHKNKNCIVVKIKSDKYFIFKDSIIEEQERLNKYTTLTEVECVINKNRENLDKEYFIKDQLNFKEKHNLKKIGMYLNTYQHKLKHFLIQLQQIL